MLQYNYDNLQRSLIDVIKEEQAKLGYYREDIRLYYPLSSLNHFFGTNVGADEMQLILDGTGEQDHTPIATGMNEALSDKLGMVEVSHRGDRFCFHIPPEGVAYVHENTTENEFIRELVELVGRHGCTMQEIRELFCKHSSHVECQKIENGEFDWMFRFAEDEEDPYYYCFKDEGIHIIYHRFLPEDYREFGV